MSGTPGEREGNPYPKPSEYSTAREWDLALQIYDLKAQIEQLTRERDELNTLLDEALTALDDAAPRVAEEIAARRAALSEQTKPGEPGEPG